MATPPNLDDLDRQLIRHLQTDGRIPYAQLGKLVGLSDAATRQRVKRLRSIGVIDIVAVTDPRRLGYQHQALIGIRTTGDLTRLATRIGQKDEAHYVVITTGRFDLMAEVVCPDAERLLLVSNEIRTLEGVLSVEVMPYLGVTKETYDWGAGVGRPNASTSSTEGDQP